MWVRPAIRLHRTTRLTGAEGLLACDKRTHIEHMFE
jgi:hypothetical protein